MQHDETAQLARRGDEEIGNRSPALAPLGQQALYLTRAPNMVGSRLDQSEGLECLDETVPFLRASRRVPDLEIADPRTGQLAA